MLPEHCEGGPAQRGLAGLSQTQGMLRTMGAAGESQPSEVPWESKRDLALQSLTSHITAKEKVQKPLLLPALLVQLICFGVCFHQRAGLVTAAVNLIKHFNRVYKY